MKKQDHAIKLAKMGFHVFPLVPNSKVPLKEAKDFPNTATTDPKKILEWWDKNPDANIGISTTRYNGSGALVAVDVDNKNGVSGDDTLFGLELDGKLLVSTFTQHTPTGGKHLLYYAEKPVKQGVAKLGKGIDIRSRGGYVVGAGSTIDGKAYTADDVKLSPAPKWLIEKCGEAKEKPKSARTSKIKVNDSAARARATDYLKNSAPMGEAGSRNQTAFAVAARIKDFGVSAEACFELMADQWECEGDFSDEELRATIEHAYHYGEKAPGADAPEASFDAVAPAEAEKHYLEKINDEYALLFEGGGHCILHETQDVFGREHVIFMEDSTFKLKFENKLVFTSEKNKTVNPAKQWLGWKERREYLGLCFSPEKEAPEGFYNLWRGFTVEPLAYEEADLFQRAGFDAFMEHAKANVCAGDERLYQWLMGYLAHMIQKPYERPLTTLVFQGKKGTGKNSLIHAVGELLGKHYLLTSDERYLTSNFNGHLDSCLCLVLDEVTWGGNKAAEGRIKTLTTEDKILIERKGKEPYESVNLARVVIIGNSEWLVPATEDERRFAVFKVGEGRKQDTKFFSEMMANLRMGGNRILLDFLKRFDLTKVNPNVAPKTVGLMEQQMHGDAAKRWWFQCLSEGTIAGGEWETRLDKAVVRHSYTEYLKAINSTSRRLDDQSLGREIRKYCPAVKTKGKRREGAYFARFYEFPSLEEARESWETLLGQTINWSDEE